MNTNTPMYVANDIRFPKSCNATLDYEAISQDSLNSHNNDDMNIDLFAKVLGR